MAKRTIGKFKGRVVAGSQTFGRAGTGTEQIGLACEVTEGDRKGRQYPWIGPLNDQANIERAMRTLVYAGWDGVTFDEKLTGLGSKDVMLTLEEDEYQGEKRERVAWIDDPDSAGVFMKDTYDVAEKKDFFSRLQGAVSECRTKGVIPKPGQKPTVAKTDKASNGPAAAKQQQQAEPDQNDSIPF